MENRKEGRKKRNKTWKRKNRKGKETQGSGVKEIISLGLAWSLNTLLGKLLCAGCHLVLLPGGHCSTPPCSNIILRSECIESKRGETSRVREQARSSARSVIWTAFCPLPSHTLKPIHYQCDWI